MFFTTYKQYIWSVDNKFFPEQIRKRKIFIILGYYKYKYEYYLYFFYCKYEYEYYL